MVYPLGSYRGSRRRSRPAARSSATTKSGATNTPAPATAAVARATLFPSA